MRTLRGIKMQRDKYFCRSHDGEVWCPRLRQSARWWYILRPPCKSDWGFWNRFRSNIIGWFWSKAWWAQPSSVTGLLTLAAQIGCFRWYVTQIVLPTFLHVNGTHDIEPESLLDRIWATYRCDSKSSTVQIFWYAPIVWTETEFRATSTPVWVDTPP